MLDIPIFVIVLFMALGFGVVLFLIKITLPRIFRNVLDHYGRRLEIAEQIMNTRRAPIEWLIKHVKQLEEAKDTKHRERIQRRAVNLSIKRLGAVINFLKSANIFDTPETKRTVLNELVRVRREWQDHGWAHVEPDANYVLLRDRPEEREDAEQVDSRAA